MYHEGKKWMNKELFKGIKAAIPIVLGYLPIGLAFGILGSQQGLSVIDIFVMSLFVYAGSSQFIAAAMMASGAEAISIISTTFLVNLRHLLMSASLSPHLKHISTGLQSLIAVGITDETFAVSRSFLNNYKASSGYFMGLHITSHVCWILSTVLGGVFGSKISEATKWGVDFALSAMFIGLLMMQVKSKKDIIVSLCSGALSLFLAINLQGNWNVIIAAVAAATIGVVLERWTTGQSLSSLE
jgi:4-azaleucine resistance transporter AzlC